MAGKIEYSLGLATAGFLGPLGNVASKLSGFLGATASLGAAASAVFSQINRGGALVDLSNRTGEAVKDLYQLQHAFQQSGVAGTNVAPLLQRFRQSLSGVGEMGESTAEAFQLIGVSMEELKKMDAPQALQALFAGLSKLDRNTATGAAGKIFGRGAAGDILQLARDADGFADALQRAEPHAVRMAQNAAAFDRLGDTLGDLKLELDGIALAVAEKVVPALNLITTQLRDKDFAGIGQVFELSMKAGIQEVTYFMADAAQSWGDMLRKALKTGADEVQDVGFWEKVGKGSLGVAAGLSGLWGQLGGAIGIPGAQAQGDLRIEQAEKLFQAIGLGGGTLSAVAEEMAKNPGARVNVFREELKKMIEEDAKAGGGLGAALGRVGGGLNLAAAAKSSGKSAFADVNALQRIGLTLGGGTDANSDMRAMRKGIDLMVGHLAAIRNKPAAPVDFRNHI